MLHDVDSAFAAQGHRPMLPPLVCHMPMHPRCRRREDLDVDLEDCPLNCTLDDDVHEDLSQASLHHLLLHILSYLCWCYECYECWCYECYECAL